MKYFLYVVYILIIFIIFIPKEKFYYTMESILSSNHIYLNEEEIINGLFSLNINKIKIIMDTVEIAKIENIEFSPWLIYNDLKLNEISVSSEYKIFFPGKIDNIDLKYSILNPLSIKIHGEAEFGQFNGGYDLIDNKIKVVFESTPELKKYPLLLSKLHKKEGGLVFESNF